MLGFIAMLCLLVFALQFATVQTFVTKKVANYLSKELKASVSIEHVYFRPFSDLRLEGFSLADPKGQTIVSAEAVQANLMLRHILENKIVLEEITLQKAYVDFQVYKDSSNFKFLIDYFNPKKKEEGKKKKPMQLKLHNLNLVDNHIKIKNHTQRHHQRGVDFSDIELQDLQLQLAHIEQDSSSFKTQIKKLSLREKSGFEIKKLVAQAAISNTFMEFDDLDLQTNRSQVGRYLKFSYADFGAFGDFIKKVHIAATMDDVYVDSRDIEYFAPDLKFVQFKASVPQATVDGTVAFLKAKNAYIKTGKETLLRGDFSIKGLPDINKTIFDFQAEELQTSAKDLELLIPQLANRSSFQLPEQLHRFGQLSFNGTFEGLYNLFSVKGDFKTALGNLKTDGKVNLQGEIQYEGQMASPEFNIGELLQSKSIKKTGFDMHFDGQGLAFSQMNLQLDGYLRHFEFGDYRYDSLQVNALLDKKRIELMGFIQDRNLQLNYQSNIDLQHEETIYVVDSEIEYLNLKRMGLVEKDSIVIFNSHILTNLSGNNLNNLNGDLLAQEINMRTSKGDFTVNDLFFSAEGNQTDRLLTLRSNVMDAEMKGVIDLNTLIPYFKALAMRYAPAIGLSTEPYNPQIFDIKVNVKSFEPVSAFLDPTLTLEDGASLEAHFSSEEYTAQFKAFSPLLKYQGFNLENLTITENADQKAFSLDLTADKLFLSDSIFVRDIEINNMLSNDSLLFSIRGANEADLNYLRLNGDIHFAHNKPAYIHFNKSAIIINQEAWSLNTDAEMRVSKGKFYLNNLIASQGQQKVVFNGVLSNEDDQLNVNFSRFNLHSLAAILRPIGIRLDGELNGDIEVHSVFKKPYLSANVQTTPLVYNQIPIGQLKLLADFDPASKQANLDIQLLDELNKGLTLKGTYQIGQTDQELNLSGKLNELELILFQPFVRNLTSQLQGKMNADIQIGGTLRHPLFNGIARIQQASFVVNYLKTPYVLNNQSVLLDKNNIMLSNLTFQDKQGHQAVGNGIVNLNKLSNPYIDVDVLTNNTMILNTTYKDNNLYFGTAYATGSFAFKGLTSAIDINIKARSEDNTSITIPFNSAMTVTDSDFIYFVSPDSSKNKQQESKYFLKGMTMNMDLELTPDAEVNLQTDLGSLKGNGAGEITLKVSSLGDFEMFGDYVVNSGKFHFTAQDFFNKFFDIKQGGTIRWTGSPSGATVNMTAIYQQRTSIRPLYDAAGRAGQDERVMAQADMNIKGTLSQPDVSFDLNFPQTPYVKDELQAYLSDANNVNQQALSLIVRRSFTASSNNEIGREVNNTLLSAGTEIAFNQLNNILAQSLNIDFLDFNIRSLNDASASVRFFNDRLVLTGGIVDRRNIVSTDLTFFSNKIATDAEMTFKLRRDGNLMFRAYNRLNTRNILFTPTDDYINAVGLVYRQEFNTLGEFWRKLWNWNGKRIDLPVKPIVEPDSSKH
ncbi:translocation/assembly module TamB domain-containing protein [Sphingobacterium humi]|nr:translocation/assembly module TamB domain-containing protein [Sphingobacterium humi]